MAQKTGHAFLVGYFFILLWDLTTTLGWLLIPAPLALGYGILTDVALIYIISAMIYDIVADRWGRTNRIIARTVQPIYLSFRANLRSQISRFWEKRRIGFPRKFRDFLRLLGYRLGWGQTFGMRMRRGYLIFPILLVWFFIFRQYLISLGNSPDDALVGSLSALIALLLFVVRIVVVRFSEARDP